MTTDPQGSGSRYPIRVDRLLRPLFTLLGASARRDVAEIRPSTLHVRLGWLFRTTIDRSSIRSAAHHRNMYSGWGAHGWRGRWLVNGSSKGIVQIDLEPRQRARLVGIWPLRLRVLYVSLVDPDGFLAELGAPAPHDHQHS